MKKLQGHASLIVAFIAVLTAMIVACFSGDYFFDLNDDVLMKDILSGAYTGVPEGHNIQMLYPISLFISILYRTGVNIDWYGIFLWFCQYFCFGVIIYKSVSAVRVFWKKALVAALEVLVILGFYLPHLLYVQYTVVCGLLSATAAFLIIAPTGRRSETVLEENRDPLVDKHGPKLAGFENITALVMLTVAYLLRSEMMLLTLPMVGVAVLIKWAFVSLVCRETTGKKKALGVYASFCGCIAVLLFISTLLHNIGYSSPEWKEFNRFFDNRTELYDFQYIPGYEENKAFYDSIGLSKSQWQLLVNYNFGLDDEINADVLLEVADYAASIKGEETPFFTRFKTAMGLYIYRLHHMAAPKSYEYPMTDFPWNIGVIVLYISVFIAALMARDDNSGKGVIPGIGFSLVATCLLVVLFTCRSALWVFIILRGRDPIRITHPLYLVEACILTAMLLHAKETKFGDKTEDKTVGRSGIWRIIPLATMILMGVIGVIALPSQINVIAKEKTLREEMLVNYRRLDSYVRQNPDNFYFYDVYSSVSYASVAKREVATYSEKLFENVDNSCYNRDILGGWASKSPLAVKKIKNLGFDSVSQAMLDSKTYFVQNKTEDVTWLEDFYEDKGINVEITRIDTIADIFSVYQVTEIR